MRIDPFVVKALSQAPSTLPADVSDIQVEVLRENYEVAARAARQPYPPELTVSDYQVKNGDRTFAVRVYRPACATSVPGVLYLHGGGWVIGSIDSHDTITAAMALRTGALVASVDYALAPEHPHPAAIEDVEAAAAWLLENAATLGVDPKRLAISGDSAGAHLATLFGVRAALDLRTNPFSSQLLFYPAVDGGANTPSFRENAHAPVLSAALMRWFLDAYCPPEERHSPRAFPLHATSLRGQPEAYIVSAGHDPLRDEAAQYAGRLATDGVSVTYRHAADLVHGFLRLCAVSSRARDEFDLGCAWLVRSLGSGLHLTSLSE